MMEKSNQFEKNFTVDGWIIGLVLLTIIVLAVILQEGPKVSPQEQEVIISESKQKVSPTAAIKAAVEAKKQRHITNDSSTEENKMKTELSEKDRARLRAIITGGS